MNLLNDLIKMLLLQKTFKKECYSFSIELQQRNKVSIGL